MRARWFGNCRRRVAMRVVREYPHWHTMLVSVGGRVIETTPDRAIKSGYRPLARKPGYANSKPVSRETIEELSL